MDLLVPQYNTTYGLPFVLVLASDHITGATGISPTVTICKNAGAYAVPAGAIVEDGNGNYHIAPNAVDADTLGPLRLHAEGTGCDPCDESYQIVYSVAGLAAVVSGGTIPAATVRDLITAALFELGALQAGEVPSPEDAELGLLRLNDWIDALKTEGLSVYTQTRTTGTLTPSATSYSVGIGGTIAVDRPLNAQDILQIGYVDTTVTPALEQLQGPVLTLDQYAAIPMKTFTSGYPTRWYYDPSYPLGTLYPYPVPTGSGLQYVIYTPAPMGEFGGLSEVIALPPGYRRFLRTNLAVELASAFGLPVPNEVALAARESKANIKRRNMRLRDMHTYTPFDRWAPSNIYTDS